MFTPLSVLAGVRHGKRGEVRVFVPPAACVGIVSGGTWETFGEDEYIHDLYCFDGVTGQIMYPRKILEVLTPSTSKCELIWKQGLHRCNQVKRRSYWIKVGLNLVTGALI